MGHGRQSHSNVIRYRPPLRSSTACCPCAWRHAGEHTPCQAGNAAGTVLYRDNLSPGNNEHPIRTSKIMQYAQKQSTAAAAWARVSGKYVLIAFDGMGAGLAGKVRGGVWCPDVGGSSIDSRQHGHRDGRAGTRQPERYAGSVVEFRWRQDTKKGLARGRVSPFHTWSWRGESNPRPHHYE